MVTMGDRALAAQRFKRLPATPKNEREESPAGDADEGGFDAIPCHLKKSLYNNRFNSRLVHRNLRVLYLSGLKKVDLHAGLSRDSIHKSRRRSAVFLLLAPNRSLAAGRNGATPEPGAFTPDPCRRITICVSLALGRKPCPLWTTGVFGSANGNMSVRIAGHTLLVDAA